MVTTPKPAFTVADIQALFTPAQLSSFFHEWSCSGVSTDTRTLGQGELFIALRGERFDAHDHIEKAVALSPAAIVIEQSHQERVATLFPDVPCICVANTLDALAQIARYHRLRFDIPIIAVAGASGKTSTKDLAAHVLSSHYTVLKTHANHNNQIGTPQTLLQLTEHHTAAVIEIGTNEPGEIQRLSWMVEPTHGIITNIGKEHLELLGNLDGVEREETALFRHLHSHSIHQKTYLLVNIDDNRLRTYTSMASDKSTVISFGLSQNATSATVSAHVQFNQTAQPSITCSTPVGTFTAELQSIGHAASLNAVAVCALCFAVGLELEQIHRGLESYIPQLGSGYARMVVQHTPCNSTILNDCYNANPESMSVALSTLKTYPVRNAGKRIAILGDMREMGDAAFDEHCDLLLLASQNADVLILIGEEMCRAFASRRSGQLPSDMPVVAVATKHEALPYITPFLQEDNVLLVKASRGLAFEELIDSMMRPAESTE